MFIRFKRVKLSDKKRLRLSPEYSVHLVLIKSYRLKGKPRQRVLKYLGAIREKDLKNPILRRVFLKKIEYRIDELNLDPRHGARLKVSLIRKAITYPF